MNNTLYSSVFQFFGKKFKAAAMLSVFTVSAAVHEYVLSICFGFFYPVLFCLFMCFGSKFPVEYVSLLWHHYCTESSHFQEFAVVGPNLVNGLEKWRCGGRELRMIPWCSWGPMYLVALFPFCQALVELLLVSKLEMIFKVVVQDKHYFATAARKRVRLQVKALAFHFGV